MCCCCLWLAVELLCSVEVYEIAPRGGSPLRKSLLLFFSLSDLTMPNSSHLTPKMQSTGPLHYQCLPFRLFLSLFCDHFRGELMRQIHNDSIHSAAVGSLLFFQGDKGINTAVRAPTLYRGDCSNTSSTQSFNARAGRYEIVHKEITSDQSSTLEGSL